MDSDSGAEERAPPAGMVEQYRFPVADPCAGSPLYDTEVEGPRVVFIASMDTPSYPVRDVTSVIPDDNMVNARPRVAGEHEKRKSQRAIGRPRGSLAAHHRVVWFRMYGKPYIEISASVCPFLDVRNPI